MPTIGAPTARRPTGAQQQTLTGREFFPTLISGPFHPARSTGDAAMTLTMIDPDPEAHRHSVGRVLPVLCETATTAEVVDTVEATR